MISLFLMIIQGVNLIVIIVIKPQLFYFIIQWLIMFVLM